MIIRLDFGTCCSRTFSGTPEKLVQLFDLQLSTGQVHVKEHVHHMCHTIDNDESAYLLIRETCSAITVIDSLPL